ncbi:MAG TPA: aldo/keto reductase [Planctomycetota bacterium]|nr:aldo/keto reductase [Planctomycetota bacterium]
MQRVRLGASGLEVSPICYGSWQLSPKFWGDQPKAVLIDAMRRAFEVGVNFYDTADAYGDGLSERVMGEALEGLPRDEIVIATKVFHHFFDDGSRHGDLSKDYILAECDAQLVRLRTDRIDLYQCHSFDPSTPLEETVDAMETLVKAGKIRAYGLSNFTADQVRLARTLGDFTTLQPRFNLMQRESEDDVLPCARAHDMGTLVYSSLFLGLLTGKYTGAETFSDFRGRHLCFRGERFRELCDRVQSVKSIAEEYGMSIVQLVLTVTLQHPLIDVAIVGIKKPGHIEEAARVMGKTVSREDYYAVRERIGTV